MSGAHTLTLAEAGAISLAAFQASNVSAENAAIVADALVAAEADGQVGHGLGRVVAYAAQARSGKVNGHAVPALSMARPGLAVVDAGAGFAFPALAVARTALIEHTPRQGIMAAFVKRSHHCGALGLEVEALADAGLVALMVANTPKAMAPWGGRMALFGTNPIAFAAPLPAGPPLVIDLSLSKVARGKVMAAARDSDPIPEGWALDPAGAPTTDAKAALAGTMIPMGDAKGAALALMVEILAGALAGPNFSYEATSFFDAEGDPPGVAQVLIAIDPAATGGEALLRIGVLAAAIEAQDGARLPGTRRLAKRQAAARDGVSVLAKVVADIRAIAAAG